jgi:TonB-dependent starch-binding outer membrane protein SusC
MASHRTCAALVAALLLAAWPGAEAAAQEAYTIRGTVVDAATQQGLPSVRVAIRGTTFAAVSDASGAYTIVARLSPGEHTLVATLLGRKSATRTVRLGAETAVQVAPIALREGAITLDQLIVTGTPTPTSRRAMGTAVSVVDAQQI